MKRYSIMVREIGSSRDVELCQLDSNPRIYDRPRSQRTDLGAANVKVLELIASTTTPTTGVPTVSI
jgi:hypothetical protein